MLLFKFNILFSILFFSLSSQANLDGLSCLQSEFSATVSHKGFPFGLTKNILKLGKKNCELTLEHEKLKFMKKKWFIDVCRAPVHIKSGTTGAIDVIKKKIECGTDSKSKADDFCKTLTVMEQIIQDDGLIFAKGEKEDISSEHGQIYCTYVLLRSYLRFNKVLSRTDKELSFDIENPSKKMKEENFQVIKAKDNSGPSDQTPNPLNNKMPDRLKEVNTDTEIVPVVKDPAIPESKELGTF